MSITLMYDATHANIGQLPPNATYAGYVTGSGSVPWTTADLKKFPDVVRIAQSPNLGIDEGVHADILDVENQAATLADCAPWARHELDAFASGARPGQRSPGIYTSASQVTNVVNALIAGGIKSGIGLWVANWNLSVSPAQAAINLASGPFPVIAVQFHNAGAFDINVASTTWLTARSSKAVQPPVHAAVPPGQWADANAWTWRTAVLSGLGLDNGHHEFDLDPKTGKWLRKS